MDIKTILFINSTTLILFFDKYIVKTLRKIVPNIQESINEFMFHCQYEKNLSDKTIKAYKIDLKQFLEFKNITTLNIEIIDKIIMYSC